ncbi:MAG: cation:proton antiporter [Oscillospiraceae bacterium]|nr:cation:proton antiporter [Oscillospiraceae bacterium]
MDFDVMNIVFDCAVILLATKTFGIVTRKLGLPQVVGMILAGLLIGPAIFSRLGIGFNGIVNPTDIEMDVLQSFSQIGVIFILFSSGLETDIKELKRSGAAASAIATAGVIVPVVFGTIGSLLFMGGLSEAANQGKLMNALFIGTILSATSVGITVETLRELGKLNTKVGTTILSAAIIDDVLGIITLSIITGLNGGGSIWITLLKAAGFFVFAVGIGLFMRWCFKRIIKRYPHKRRTGIFALVMCFAYAYCAEKFFDIAAITGAYMAGLMLSGLKDTSFVDRKVIVSGYMIFTPIFFAYIGISADFSNFRLNGLMFALVFVLLGVFGKIIGCGGVARACRYSGKQSLAVGCGMIARGEVALAVYSAGKSLIYYENGRLAGIDPLVATICLIVLSSILCPILLKLAFKKHSSTEDQSSGGNNSKTTIFDEALNNHSEPDAEQTKKANQSA